MFAEIGFGGFEALEGEGLEDDGRGPLDPVEQGDRHRGVGPGLGECEGFVENVIGGDYRALLTEQPGQALTAAGWAASFLAARAKKNDVSAKTASEAIDDAVDLVVGQFFDRAVKRIFLHAQKRVVGRQRRRWALGTGPSWATGLPARAIVIRRPFSASATRRESWVFAA